MPEVSVNPVTSAVNKNLEELSGRGVSVWLDDLSRDRLRSGDLEELVNQFSVVGVTTNPSIFGAAISGSSSYDDQLHAMAVRGVSVDEALRTITAADVRDACDLLAPVSERGHDGRVSLEVSPGVARDTDATASEAAHLWWLVDRPNLMIKIPATLEGLPAITSTIARGISVNVTLIFSIERYKAVMEAYLAGLEERLEADPEADLGAIESVASFFVSRVDTEIDRRLEALGEKELMGRAGVANAQLAYQAFEETFSGARWEALSAKGANKQRPLWASTGVKNAAYPDTLYVSELVAPGVVNTMPEKTLRHYADHGAPGEAMTSRFAEAAETMKAVADAGVDLTDVFAVLEEEAVQKFVDAWDELTSSVKEQLEKKA